MRRTGIVTIIASAIALFTGDTAASAQTARPGSALKGIEPSDLDRSADPCTDFHAFANGAWRAAHPIPAGGERWSRRYAAREANRRELKTLLEEMSSRPNRPRGAVEQLLGDHFGACMNETAIDAAGMARSCRRRIAR